MLLFTLLFTVPAVGFWYRLAGSTGVLALTAALLAGAALRGLLVVRPAVAARSFLLGIATAEVMYLVFYVGRAVAQRCIPDADQLIGSIYTLGHGTSSWVIAAILLLIVGPCEEIFWRGYIQNRLCQQYGWKGVVLGVLLYTGVHVATSNTVMILAAAVCGTFWGLLYYRYRNLLMNVVSHAVWAAIVFALLPLG